MWRGESKNYFLNASNFPVFGSKIPKNLGKVVCGVKFIGS